MNMTIGRRNNNNSRNNNVFNSKNSRRRNKTSRMFFSMSMSMSTSMSLFHVPNVIFVFMTTASLLLFHLCSTNTIVMVEANWIDPDTPEGAYSTRPRYVPPPSPPKAKPDNGSSKSKSKSKSAHSEPTVEPSSPPTTSPTNYPTFEPTTLKDVNDTRIYHLVMSDEFNIDGRSFKDGHDPKWTALDKNDYTNGALHYYSPDNIQTQDGDLVITTEAKKTQFEGFNDTSGKDEISSKNFKSAMLQSWNKFCFTGGIVEAEIQLPGKAEVGGLWPAFWLLGNLARHTYVGSTNHLWPWSSNTCSIYSKNSQRITGCMKSQHYGLQPSFGRGAPEIDIFEVQTGKTKANTKEFLESSVGQPFMSTSFQVAPGRVNNRPGGGWWPGPGQWYEGLKGGVNSSLNIFFYGDYNHFRGDSDEKDYWSDAVSYNHQMQDTHFEKKYRYRLEWELPDDQEGHDGYIRWFINDRFVFEINGTGIVDAGMGSTVSTEPMYIIMNTAISSQWGFPHKCPSNCPCSKYDCLSRKFTETCGFNAGFCDMLTNQTDLPKYKVNYVRVYQNKDNPNQKVGCSTPERPTSRYIKGHESVYMKRGDTMPLKPIQKGQGKCTRTSDGSSGEGAESCGGPTRGLCNAGRVCECRSGWTGPHCLAVDGYDPVQYERKDGFTDLEFTGPITSWCGLYVGLAVIGALFLFAPTIRHQMDGWKPLPVA